MICGTCSLCGGAVTTPDVWSAVTPPPKTCSSCGAVAAQSFGPVIPMQRPRRSTPPIFELAELWELAACFGITAETFHPRN